MRALILRTAGAPFELAEVPDPRAGAGEAVARVLACGVGLTVQHVKAGRTRAVFPRILGHEIAGEIVEVGAGVEGLAVGDAVTAHFYLFCGHCRECLAGFEPLCPNLRGQVGKACDGGYAEYIRLPARNFLPLPEAIDHRAFPAEAGVIADALATPWKVVKRSRLRPGEWVAVFGAGGGLGLHQVMIANWAGARVIAVDIVAAKLDACRRAGAEAVIDASACDVAEALLTLTHGDGVDVAVDYVSSGSTLGAAAAALGRHGRLVTLGGAGQEASLAMSHLRLGEREILASRYVSRADILATLDLVARGAVWPIVTDVRPLEAAEVLHADIERGAVTGRAALRIA